MTGSRGHAFERWRGVDAVVAAYAGTRSGDDAFVRAVHSLRDALPGARVSLLCPAEARPAVTGDRVIEYTAPREGDQADDAARDAALRTVDALSRLGAQAALVFTEHGAAPYAPAYLCYLAGIAYRAGFEAEFGGAVLSPALKLPPGLQGEERHLALLAAVGLARRIAPCLASPPAAPSTNRSGECDS